MFACDACGKTFATAQGQRTHHRQVHELGLVNRQELARGTDYDAVKRPRIEAMAASEYCGICDDVFESLEAHLHSFRPVKAQSLPCGECGREFKDERALSQHSVACKK